MSTVPAAEFWDKAACVEVGQAAFFPDRGETGTYAKHICMTRCPVRERCLEWALTQPDAMDQYGVFGGLSPRERRAVRKQRREATA